MAKKVNEIQKKKNCFIIMPFGSYFDKYYLEIYVPAIEKAGFVANRADDLYRPGNIVSDIWNYTKDADVILADLTNKNPNVFYELGLAHAITKPAILLTSSMEDVPFDLRSLRVIAYDKNLPDWGDILKEKIANSLDEIVKNPEDAIPPTFFDVSKSKRVKVSEEEKEILNLKKEMDSLKREVRSSRHLSQKRRKDNAIEPAEAESLIKSFLEQGVEDITIAENLEPLGPPINWTMDKIRKLKDK